MLTSQKQRGNPDPMAERGAAGRPMAAPCVQGELAAADLAETRDGARLRYRAPRREAGTCYVAVSGADGTAGDGPDTPAAAEGPQDAGDFGESPELESPLRKLPAVLGLLAWAASRPVLCSCRRGAETQRKYWCMHNS